VRQHLRDHRVLSSAVELDLSALQQLPQTEAQATSGNPLDPETTDTCAATCGISCVITSTD
jgi:hypothetical protein